MSNAEAKNCARRRMVASAKCICVSKSICEIFILYCNYIFLCEILTYTDIQKKPLQKTGIHCMMTPALTHMLKINLQCPKTSIKSFYLLLGKYFITARERKCYSCRRTWTKHRMSDLFAINFTQISFLRKGFDSVQVWAILQTPVSRTAAS